MLAILSYHYGFFFKLKFSFLVELYHFLEKYDAGKYEVPVDVENEI